ncbi:MAG: UDP-2,3-diacylglucosamine diphosphatase LpxI [Alphaproteobacteria bacterium]|jgi:DUF1009 family protein|nr:UDP-2,3-diacylglucosamine diphosphatase LpxI [Pseudomonadota bacterium]|tara:strand:+ start:4297 stop:5097 length:801 start_codon:yes stop_codon:yes gene_type:complete
MARLAVIAGKGALPATLADNARSLGEDVVIIRIAGQADADFSAFEAFDVRLGAVGRARDLIRDAGCDRVVMIGKISRPPLSQLKPDAAAVKLLARAVGRGDDALLRVISDFLAEAGIETVSPEQFLPGAMMPAGIATGMLDDAMGEDVNRGSAVLDALGGHDVGQGVVLQDGRVIAIEGAEGTDGMLRRIAPLIDPASTPAIFVKRRKSGQDTRLDIPVVGEETLRLAADCGVRVLALEAGGVMLATAPETLWEIASDLELTVIGI